MSHASDYRNASEGALHFAIDDLADQLAVAVDGRFEFTVKAALPDESLDKLAMLINFVIEAARRALVDLKERNEQLAEIDRLKSALLANVSHELRTPLALILGPTEKWLTSGVLPAEQRRDLEVVMRNARALLKTVNDLLDVSKVEAGRLVPRFVRANLAELVRATCSLFEGIASERGVAFVASAPRKLIAEIDYDMIQRVLLNLLSNAFKYGLGGGRISCDAESIGSTAVLRVEDHGPGIARSMRERIFDRFVQVDAAATRKAGGTGLGLAIAKELVELHHGTIEAMDAPGGGALFIVTLPLKAPVGTEVLDETRSPPSAELAASPGAETIDELRAPALEDQAALPRDPDAPVVLVVEDNPEMNRFISSTLFDEYRVVSASTGREALAQLARQQPDLVVTDVMMPEMSGDDLVREIRKVPTFDAIPIIVLTAKADDALRVRLLETGAQDYVMKPFSRPELKVRVRNLIQRVLLLEREHSARQEAERAAELAELFVAVLGHDLRNPLAAMQMGGMLLASTGDKRNREIAARITSSAERMARMIDQILDFSRIRSGQGLPQNPTQMDLRDVLSRVVQELTGPNGGGKVVIEIDGDTRGRWDDDRLAQVFSNLIGNALEHSPEGAAVHVSVEARDATNVAVSVTNPGVIPEQFVPELFEPFRKADQQGKSRGLGLGLYIAKEIVKAHGGTIDVTTSHDQGTRFRVVLPRCAA